ncbi:hypothetical protein [Pelagibius sp.]|uniref:hypothetical protein n=1 Tax=Pelagibius sp. TaxID=1931238 RepID=UPI002627BA57|nr:hypothetical protein [Pelagibius sp.]
MIYVLRVAIVLLSALAATSYSLGLASDRLNEHPDPLIVLIERDPSLMVIGSDSPTFALYADGMVIFRDESYAYFSVHLDEQQKNTLLAEITPRSITGLREYYQTVYAFGVPTNELYVWVDGRRTRVDVYGVLRSDTNNPRSDEWAPYLDRPPAAYLRAFDAIVSFAPEASPWLPERVEVMIWPFEYSREEPLAWPADWPPFESAERAIGSELHRLYLPASEFQRLQRLIKEMSPSQAVELGGRKWSIAYRFPFPNESTWMR